MSCRTWITAEELDEARCLYADGLSWREVALVIGRNTCVITRRLGKECSRSRSEAHKLMWREKKPAGPRNLTASQMTLYRKLRRYAGMSGKDAMREVLA